MAAARAHDYRRGHTRKRVRPLRAVAGCQSQSSALDLRGWCVGPGCMRPARKATRELCRRPDLGGGTLPIHWPSSGAAMWDACQPNHVLGCAPRLPLIRSAKLATVAINSVDSTARGRGGCHFGPAISCSRVGCGESASGIVGLCSVNLSDGNRVRQPRSGGFAASQFVQDNRQADSVDSSYGPETTSTLPPHGATQA